MQSHHNHQHFFFLGCGEGGYKILDRNGVGLPFHWVLGFGSSISREIVPSLNGHGER